MRSSSRAIGLFFFSAIATSIFIVFNLTGIFCLHWAYVLVPMYLPMLLMVAYYYVFVRQVFSKKNHYSDDPIDDKPPYRTVKRIEIIKEENYPNSFVSTVQNIVNNLLDDPYCSISYQSDKNGKLIAVIEYTTHILNK